MTHNPYKHHSKQELVKLYLKYNKLQKKMEAKLDDLEWQDYLNQVSYLFHFENTFQRPLQAMLDKTKRRWNLS